MTWNLEQTMSLIKAAQHKYTHRKLVGRDPKTGRPRYRYYYARHHGGGITGAAFEAGSAFRLTFKGRTGHFHVESVDGDMVTVRHDGRKGSEPIEMSRDELRALLERQHSKLETASREKAQRRRKSAAKKRKSTKRQAPKTQTTAPKKTMRSYIAEQDEKISNLRAQIERLEQEEKNNPRLDHFDEIYKIKEEIGTLGRVRSIAQEADSLNNPKSSLNALKDPRDRTKGIIPLEAYNEIIGILEDTVKTQAQTPREQLTETAQQGADNFEAMPEVESLANKKTTRERSLALRGYKPEELIEIAAHAAIQDKAVNKEVDAKARELEREYKDLANTAARLGSEEELAKEGGNYRYQDAEQAAREKHEERLNLARIDIYNKVYRDTLSHLRDQKADYVERRIAIESRIKELNLSTDSLETTPATTPINGTAQRQSVLDAAEEAQRLDAQGDSKRSAAAIAADERLAETIRNLISNEYQDVEDVTRSGKPRRQWTVKERELNSLTDRLETLQSAKKRTRSMTAATAQNIRETTRGRLIDEMRRRIETDSRIKPTPQRSQTAQAFSSMVDTIKSGERSQAAQDAFKTELNKVIDKAESGTLTDAERAELLPIAEQLVEVTSGRARALMTAVRDQIKG